MKAAGKTPWYSQSHPLSLVGPDISSNQRLLDVPLNSRGKVLTSIHK